jgi:hypothetical protein
MGVYHVFRVLGRPNQGHHRDRRRLLRLKQHGQISNEVLKYADILPSRGHVVPRPLPTGQIGKIGTWLAPIDSWLGSRPPIELGKIAFKCPDAFCHFTGLFELSGDDKDVEKVLPTIFLGQRDGTSQTATCLLSDDT